MFLSKYEQNVKVLIFQEDPTVALLKVHYNTTEILMKVCIHVGFLYFLVL